LANIIVIYSKGRKWEGFEPTMGKMRNTLNIILMENHECKRSPKGYMGRCQVKVALCLINKALRHKDVCGEWRYSSTSLTLVLDGGEWSVSLPSRFIPGEIALVAHWIGS
jgi:hypothetical protein